MPFRSPEGPDRTRRGQSTLIGLVLLIGMAAAISTSMLLVAGTTTADIQQDSEDERVESAFVELGQQLMTTSTESDVARSIDIDVGQDGAVVREDSGTINVSSEALETTALEDLTIGTVEYEGDGGTTIAYEAGAVFRETGNETRVVSAPPIHYETETDTLTMPVTTITGEQELGTGDVRLEHAETEAFREATVVENDSVTITIESDYYRGWESFFRNQAGDTSVQRVDHENRTIEVEVGYIDLESAYDSGVTYSEEVDDFKDEFGDDARVGNMPEMDPVIEEMREDAIEEANENPAHDLGTITGDVSLDDGLYYADEIDLQDSNTISADASSGNVTILVDGDVTISDPHAEVTVDTEGEDNALRIYLTGNFNMDKGKVAPDSSIGETKSEQLQVYGTSDLDGRFWDGNFTGTFYAASNDWEGPNELTGSEYQVDFHSNPEFNGGLVVHSANIHASAAEFEYDDSLEGGEFNAYPGDYTLPPQLTYLNVAKHEIEIDQN
ncbi:DUF7289 family protein [Natronobacterium lacisalsi]